MGCYQLPTMFSIAEWAGDHILLVSALWLSEALSRGNSVSGCAGCYSPQGCISELWGIVPPNCGDESPFIWGSSTCNASSIMKTHTGAVGVPPRTREKWAFFLILAKGHFSGTLLKKKGRKESSRLGKEASLGQRLPSPVTSNGIGTDALCDLGQVAEPFCLRLPICKEGEATQPGIMSECLWSTPWREVLYV